MSVAKISPHQLKIGYFIQLPLNWMKHPFISNKFKIENYQQIAIIQTLELDFVYFFPEKSSINHETEAEPEAALLAEQSALLKNNMILEKNLRGLNKPRSNDDSCKKRKKPLHNRWCKFAM